MSEFERLGARRFSGTLDSSQVERVRSLFGNRVKPGKRLSQVDVATIDDLLVADGAIGRVAASLIGPKARPVRALLLDKSPQSNWRLGWHQDRTIAVDKRIDVDGFGPWSIKVGQPHVQPPQDVTEAMVTLRVHADAVCADNAPLLIIPGSHKLGRLSTAEVDRLAQSRAAMACEAAAGDVWAYRTAIVHASGEQKYDGRRRVLQLDYAARALPGGLEWATLVSS